MQSCAGPRRARARARPFNTAAVAQTQAIQNLGDEEPQQLAEQAGLVVSIVWDREVVERQLLNIMCK